MATQNGWNSSVLADAVTLNGGAIAVGTDATDNAIDIGTASNTGRTVTIGNITGTSTVAINTGTVGCTITTTADGNITLTPGGAGVVSVTSAPIVPTGDRADSLGSATNSWDNVYADGLSFDDGTNTLSTFVNITAWTPVIEFGGATVGITYTVQVGNYSRIGNVLFLQGDIQLTSKGTSVGSATISGFPIGTPGIVNPLACRVSNLTFNTIPKMRITGTTINFEDIASGGAASLLDNSDFANNTSVKFSGFVLLP